MVRHHYLELFKDDDKRLARAGRIAARTFEFTEYLVDVLRVTELNARFTGRITYHDACHARYGLKISEQPRRLIQKVRGSRLVEMEAADRCCGFGGSFAVKYPDISTAILKDKVDRIIASGADAVVSSDMGCLMNIAGMLNRLRQPIGVMHIAQLLEGLGGKEEHG